MKEKISEELNKRKNVNDEKKKQLINLDNLINNMISFINEQREEVNYI